MNQEHIDQNTRPLGSGLSRRGMLRTLGGIGAGGLLAVVGHEAQAADRPHQRLQDRTPQRNRKQRNKNNNQNKNATNDTQNANQLGDALALGCSVAFTNQIAVTYKVTVIGENGNVLFDCPPGFNSTLSVNDGPVTFVIQYSEWEKDLWIQAFNPDFGAPGVVYQANGCADDCGTTQTLSEETGFWINWYGNSFLVERQLDSSDYKMFFVTAYS
jgi:hypothetical protein